jgi:hypothetical protein
LTLILFLAIMKPQLMWNYIGYTKAYQWRISNNASHNTQMQVSYNVEASLEYLARCECYPNDQPLSKIEGGARHKS